MADLVRATAAMRGRVALKPSAGAVLDKLSGHAAVPFYLLRTDGDAAEVEGEHVWRPRIPSGAEYAAKRRSPYFVLACFPHMDAADAFARGLDPSDRMFNSDEDASLAELPELRGHAGALEWLRHCWVTMGTSLDDLDGADYGQPAGIAIREVDAAALFPELFDLAESRPQEVALAVAEAPKRPPRGKPLSQLPAADVLARELADLKAQGIKGPINVLAKKYGCNRATITRRFPKRQGSALARLVHTLRG
ncbi:hypothetical protein [Roseateles sp.]|uniref:hypothetical protein n=1 Tax=Roseateles sp. TaxID=1971397 RepID=UPI00394CEF84